MKKIAFLFALATGVLFLNSCSFNSQKLQVRISAVSSSGNDITFCVYPENEYGNIVTGASVSVYDENNSVTFLDFSNSVQCYKGTVTSLSSVFTVKVKSVLLEKTAEYVIPHKAFSSKPVFSKLCDSEGNSVLSGQSVDCTKKIQAAWNSLGEGTVYIVTVKNSLDAVYSVSTEADSIIIPENTLSAGSYFISVTAECIYGDCSFETENYYSASKVSGTSLAFCVE